MRDTSFQKAGFGQGAIPCDLRGVILFRYDVNQVRAESAMPSSARVERRIWWLTVSNTEDKLRRMRTDELDEALAAPSNSVTMRKGCLSGVTIPEA